MSENRRPQGERFFDSHCRGCMVSSQCRNTMFASVDRRNDEHRRYVTIRPDDSEAGDGTGWGWLEYWWEDNVADPCTYSTFESTLIAIVSYRIVMSQKRSRLTW